MLGILAILGCMLNHFRYFSLLGYFGFFEVFRGKGGGGGVAHSSNFKSIFVILEVSLYCGHFINFGAILVILKRFWGIFGRFEILEVFWSF